MPTIHNDDSDQHDVHILSTLKTFKKHPRVSAKNYSIPNILPDSCE